MKSYWKKIYRDLMSDKMQTMLVITAISIGIIGAGSITSSYAILNYEITENYTRTNPSDITIHSTSFDGNVTSIVDPLDNVDSTSLRSQVKARLFIDGEWNPIILYVIQDFQNLEVSSFTIQDGEWPQNGEIAIERSSNQINHIEIGSPLTVKVPSDTSKDLSVSGVIHDAARAPGWQDGITYGYISLETLHILGKTGYFDEIHISLDEQMDVEDVSSYATTISQILENQGYTISSVVVPEPGVHPHTDQMNSLLFLIQVFGLLTQILSGLLVYITISSLLKEQIKEIGILKSIGGKRKDLYRIYFSYVFILSVTSLLIGIPVGNWLGGVYSGFTASMLNFNITEGAIPIWVYGIEILIGFLIPFISASIPIFVISGISINEAINSHKISNGNQSSSRVDTVLTKIKLFSMPTRLSLRNSFRRRTRLILLLIMMAVGGATFIGAFNIGASWNQTIDDGFASRKYDIKVEFSSPVEITEVNDLLTSIPEISQFETWDEHKATFRSDVYQNGLIFRLTGIPVTTEMVDFPVLDGRWFKEGDTNAIIINHQLYQDDHLDVEVGDSIELSINGTNDEFKVIGIIQETGAPRRGFSSPASAYVNTDYLHTIVNATGTTTNLRIKVDHSAINSIEEFALKLESEFNNNDFPIQDLQPSNVRLEILRNHLVVILAFLVMMALLIAVVGMLALTSVTSINVIERTRELGILRAVGGQSKQITSMITTEALIISLLSWFLAVILSFPITTLAGNAAGQIFLGINLSFRYQIFPFIVWLLLISIMSWFSSLYPAKRVNVVPVHQAIQYE